MSVIKKKKKVVSEASGDLLTALNWIAVAQHDKGAVYETHCTIANGWVRASDNKLSCAHKIALDIVAAPRTERLIAALNKGSGNLALTHDGNAITVSASKFRVVVSCADVAQVALNQQQPDRAQLQVDDSIIHGMNVVSGLAKEGATSVLEASIRIAKCSIMSTDRQVVLDYWHGLPIPEMILPKASVEIIRKLEGLTDIGWSQTSATFWFGPDKWIKTQLYSEPWPDLSSILDVECKDAPVPDGLVEAIQAVAPHSEDGHIHFTPTGISASPYPYTAHFEIDLPAVNIVFNADRLLTALRHAKTIDFNAGRKALFFGSEVPIRGALCQSEK